MWKVLAVVAIGLAFGGFSADARETDSFAQGVADWRTLQAWFGSQTGDRAEGAKYWVANRNVSSRLSCAGAAAKYTGDKAAFTAGCQDAKSRLDPIDNRRRSDPEYRSGFSEGAKQQPLVAGVTSAPTQTQGSPTPTPPSPPPATSARNGWWVVMGSFSMMANASRAANDAAARCGLRAFHDLSDKFAGFTPGYHVVVSGPYGTRDEAEGILQSNKACLPPGAYLKSGEYAGNYPQEANSQTSAAPSSPTASSTTPAPPTGPAPATTPAPPTGPAPPSERERAAEDLRQRLQKQAAEAQLEEKVKEVGFKLLSPVDLNLDWKSFITNKTKVAVRGTYVQAHDIEALSTPDNKDVPSIRLYTNDASRDARKLMLECRNADFKFSACEMIVGGTIQSCVRNEGRLNERAVPCLQVQEAYLVP